MSIKKPNKMGRPKKYSGISDKQTSLIDEVFDELGSPSKGNKKQITVDKKATARIDEDYVLSLLQNLGEQGNVKAVELLGDKLDLFNSKKKDNLIDIFVTEGSLEENILRFLDILEDKYSDITIEPIIAGELEDTPVGRPAASEEEKLEKELLSTIEREKTLEDNRPSQPTEEPLLEEIQLPIDNLPVEGPESVDPWGVVPIQKDTSTEDDDDDLESTFLRF